MNHDDAEEYTQALGQVVAGGYRQVALGERLGVPEALGLSLREWVTEWNWPSNSPSELHKLGAHLFVYGFYDKEADEIVLGCAVDVAVVLRQLALGRLPYRRVSRVDQTFLGFGFADLKAQGAVVFDIDYRPRSIDDDDWPPVPLPGSKGVAV